jgi:MFS family permease
MSRDLILVAFSLMTWGLGEGMFFIFQPLYLQQLGARPVTIGAILGAVGIAMTVAHIPAGHLADHFGRRPLIRISWITGTIATWLMALAPNLPLFVAALLLYSTTTFVMSPLNSYVTAARGRLSVGRAITMISAAYSIGAILGPLLGGWFASRYGLHRVYTISASIFIVSALIVFFIRSQPIDHSPTESEAGKLKLNRVYILYLIVVFVATFSTYLPQPLTPNYLQNNKGLDIADIGRLGSIANIGVVVLNLALGSLNARLGFLLAQACASLFALLLWQGQGFAWYAIGYFLLGGYRVVRSLAVAQTRTLVHQARMGLAYGITETVGASAVILAPPLAGWLYEKNPIWIYIISIVFILISLLVGSRSIPAPNETPV